MHEIIVHCPTSKDWDEVEQKMFKEGGEWYVGGQRHLDVWSEYKSESCIYLNGGVKMTFGSIKYANNTISADEYLGRKAEAE